MTTRLTSVVIDAAHPGALAHWWSQSIGWPITYVAPDEVVVEPAGNGQSFDVPALVFVPVEYVYPSRTPTLRVPTLALGLTWALLVLLMIRQFPGVSRPILYLSLIFPAYYLVLSLALNVRRRNASR